MAVILANLNVRGLRDPNKCTRLLGELSNIGVDVTAMQETRFTCVEDCRVMTDDFVVFSASGNRSTSGVSLLVRCSRNVVVNLVFADDRSWLLVANVAIKSFKFRVFAVYAPNIVVERCPSFGHSLTARNG